LHIDTVPERTPWLKQNPSGLKGLAVLDDPVPSPGNPFGRLTSV
jgi:hypothetical protein